MSRPSFHDRARELEIGLYAVRYSGEKPGWFSGDSMEWVTIAEDVAHLLEIISKLEKQVKKKLKEK